MGRVPAKIHRIKLTDDERISLEKIRDKGSHRTQAYKRAIILLLSDESDHRTSMTDDAIGKIVGVTLRTVQRLRVRCLEVGALESLKSKPHPPRTDLIKVNGKLEASITQIACSEAPDGKRHWTMQMIADKVIAMGLVESLSAKSVERLLKKVNLPPGKTNTGASRKRTTPPS